MEQAIQSQATAIQEESNLFERVPKFIEPLKLEQVAMKICSYSFSQELEDWEVVQLEAYGFQIQGWIDLRAQQQKDLLSLQKTNRLISQDDRPEGSLLKKVGWLLYKLEETSLGKIEELEEEEDSDIELSTVQDDISNYLGENKMCQYSIKQLREVKQRIVDVLESREQMIELNGCYYIGFSDFQKIGVYSAAGKFLELLEANHDDQTNYFYHSGNNFVN